MTNSRHLNFIKLAEQRMTRIFQTANLIANLSSVSKYTFTREEIEEFWNAYYEMGERTKNVFYMSRYEPISDIEFKFETLEQENNNKNINFRRLAEQRLSKIFKNLSLISRLANRKNYTFTYEEIDFLFSSYVEKGLEIKRFFEPHLNPLSDEFTFNKL
ncbi:MAG: hypothetical protein E6778_18725 [Niallia nealsonii]|nr:hypothetical protein [Niallia nealsonii]